MAHQAQAPLPQRRICHGSLNVPLDGPGAQWTVDLKPPTGQSYHETRLVSVDGFCHPARRALKGRADPSEGRQPW
ncbi:MAG: hypothetical protein ACOYON_13765 [Fimbriimonas sp.]